MDLRRPRKPSRRQTCVTCCSTTLGCRDPTPRPVDRRLVDNVVKARLRIACASAPSDQLIVQIDRTPPSFVFSFSASPPSAAEAFLTYTSSRRVFPSVPLGV